MGWENLYRSDIYKNHLKWYYNKVDFLIRLISEVKRNGFIRTVADTCL